MIYLRKAGIGLLAGLIGGMVWGIGARIAMRIVALAAHKPTEFSLEGTALILLVGAFFGIPLGLLFAGVMTYLPGAGHRKGLSFGLLVLLIMAAPFYLGPLAAEAPLGLRFLGIAMFAALFVVCGTAVELAYQQLDRRLLTGAQRGLAAVFSCVPVSGLPSARQRGATPDGDRAARGAGPAGHPSQSLRHE